MGVKKVENSQKWRERALKVIPETGSSHGHNLEPDYGGTTLFLVQGKGSKIYDADENEYIDYICSLGALIWGHCHPKILEAVKNQMDIGTTFSTANDFEVLTAEKVVSVLPSVDMVRFVQSGTEATMHAMRLARAYTGKDKILKFEGHYHGHHDYMCNYKVNPAHWGSEVRPFVIPISPGIPKGTLESMIVLPFNNPELLEITIKRHAQELAAVILEPIMGNHGQIFPEEGYLKVLRELTRENEVLLIFDEVITGFRTALGGAQEYFGIDPDLTTLSKAFGGGCPVAAFGGTREIMEKISLEPGGVFHGGTYNGNMMGLAGVYANMEELSKGGKVLYNRFYNVGEKLIKGLEDAAERTNTSILIPGFSGWFSLFFTEKEKLLDARDVALNADAEKFQQFRREMFERGVLLSTDPYERWHVSMVHTEEDVEKTVVAAEESFRALNTH